MRVLLIDVETRSRIELKTAGARRYAMDPSTQITTACWHWKGDSHVYSACNIPGLAYLGSHTMADFVAALMAADRIVAHHVNFDACMIFATLGPCGLILEKLDCTMARAQRISLPGGLDELCKALGVPGKSADGHKLVMATCKPRRNGTFNESPEIFYSLLAYNVQDIRCLVAVDALLPPLPPEELIIWRRTWRKNAFGLPLDLHLCALVARHRDSIERQTGAELCELTGYAVTAVTQRQRILEWVRARDIWIENTQRPTLELMLEREDLPFDVWYTLTLLFEAGGSAPTKAQALLDRHVGARFQDGTRYFGARSGRGTSEGVNMFNLARPSGKHNPVEVIRRLKAEPNGIFTNTELSDVLRGAICAPPGYLVIDCDESNIELRLSLWFAGDTEKLEMLGRGVDLYAMTASWAMGISNLTKESHPKERQAYKKVVLSGGYGIGIIRLYFAFKTDKDLPFEYRRDITQQQVAAIHKGYRTVNKPLQKCWKELGDAFRVALVNPNVVIEVCGGKIRFCYNPTTDVLDMILPSGRVIPHWRPRFDEYGELTFWRAWHGKMRECRTWGGALLEIACQSSARDILTAVERAIEIELPDVTPLLDIYDSVVCLAPEAVAKERKDQIIEIMRRPLPWTVGLPLNGEGYVAERMQK